MVRHPKWVVAAVLGLVVYASPARADSLLLVGDIGLTLRDPTSCGEYVIGGTYCTESSWSMPAGGGLAAQYARSLLRGLGTPGWKGRLIMDGSVIGDAALVANGDVTLVSAGGGIELYVLYVWRVQILGGYTLASNDVTIPDRDGQPKSARFSGVTLGFSTGLDLPVRRTQQGLFGVWVGIRWLTTLGDDHSERLSLGIGLTLEPGRPRRPY